MSESINMTKQQRAELRDVKRRVRATHQERKLVFSRIDKAVRGTEKKHRQAVRASAKETAAALRVLGKERRIEDLASSKLLKALGTRQAVLEGRLAS